ncbi:MAG: hypothetical protein KDK45_05325, partial [Leptospiraceae bacterium]|nr:hypothetical protein [Leptospiraceae bacterium]
DLAFSWEKEFPKIIFPDKTKLESYYDSDLGNKRMPTLKAYSKNIKDSIKENKSGFDIVIGNPPWGAVLNKKEKAFLKKYKINDRSLNTAYLFIGRAHDLLNNSGYLGYIIPKGLTYVPNLSNVREFIKQNFNVLEIIDTSESFHRSGVDLEAIILISNYSNEKKNVFTGFFDNNKLYKNKTDYSLVIRRDKYGIWINNNNKNIISKIQQKSIRLENICVSQRGININKYVSEKKSSFVVIGGAPIFRYYIDHLTYAEQKYISNDFSWQLKKKIILQEIVGRVGKPLFGNYRKIVLNATIDNEGTYYTLDTVVNLYDFKTDYSIEYVLAILNSKLISYYFHIYNCAFSQITLHSGNENARSIPILILEEGLQKKFIKNVNTLLLNNEKLKNLKYDFIELLLSDFQSLEVNIKSNLNQWYLLDWKEFVAELKKKKITMTDDQEIKWFKRFKQFKEEALKIKEIIDTTDAEIDLMVYKLYELTHDEVKIVDPEFAMSQKAYNEYKIPEE